MNIFMKKVSKLNWFNVENWGIEGKGWVNTANYYDRLPPKAESLLPDLWPMSTNPTGHCVFFETDASEIHAQWILRSPELDEPNMSRVNFSGLDLYAHDGQRWCWAGATSAFNNQLAKTCLVDEIIPEKRLYRIYLSARNSVQHLEIGVPSDSFFKPVKPRLIKSIVYYGSSIIHGAYASRPGMNHPAVLGRWLDRPVVNLGFSGEAKMHEPMAYLLAELDPAVYVLDALPNMDIQLLNERAENFLTILASAKKQTPIVIVEDFPLTNGWIRKNALKLHQEKWKSFHQVYRKLQKHGFNHIHYVKGVHSIGDDHEGTLDGIHPNDLGYRRLAENLFPVLKEILSIRS